MQKSILEAVEIFLHRLTAFLYLNFSFSGKLTTLYAIFM